MLSVCKDRNTFAQSDCIVCRPAKQYTHLTEAHQAHTKQQVSCWDSVKLWDTPVISPPPQYHHGKLQCCTKKSPVCICRLTRCSARLVVRTFQKTRNRRKHAHGALTKQSPPVLREQPDEGIQSVRSRKGYKQKPIPHGWTMAYLPHCKGSLGGLLSKYATQSEGVTFFLNFASVL